MNCRFCGQEIARFVSSGMRWASIREDVVGTYLSTSCIGTNGTLQPHQPDLPETLDRTTIEEWLDA